MKTPDYDIIIVGGGMAGATFACSLAHTGLSIALIEAVAPPKRGKRNKQPGYDDRTVALGHGSWRILHALGVAEGIEAGGVTPIEHIHISEKGGFGIARMESEEERVAALGYVVENRVIGNSLWRQLDAAQNIEVITPATVTDATNYLNQVVVNLEDGRELSAKLLVIADGGRSAAREKAGFEIIRKPYGQTAIVANITAEHGHDNTAWERFTGDGAVALLPMTEQRYSLVWSVPGKRVDYLMQLPDEAFLRELQSAFGHRCGRFIKAGKRAAYPLALEQAHTPAHGRTALIGNASWSMHPVAGQGFNRGLRDVGALAELVNEAALCDGDVGNAALLRAYIKRRAADDRIMTRYTDTLVKTFTSPFPPLKLARNLGLAGVSALPCLRHSLATLSMGEHARLPRLRKSLPAAATITCS